MVNFALRIGFEVPCVISHTGTHARTHTHTKHPLTPTPTVHHDRVGDCNSIRKVFVGDGGVGVEMGDCKGWGGVG